MIIDAHQSFITVVKSALERVNQTLAIKVEQQEDIQSELKSEWKDNSAFYWERRKAN